MHSRAEDEPQSPPRWHVLLACAIMFACVLGTYASPELLSGRWRLDGIDYTMLHQRRIDFALQQLSQHGAVPGWYPREQMGVPFWSNVQSFPLLPTRLLLLPTGADNVFTLAVLLAAGLSAGFTYLFARRLGVGPVGSAAAGYTFACCGYFASRVLAGQLGMIESYPALPILLYVAERLRTAAAGRPAAAWGVALAACSGGFSVSAHPQLPIYALIATAAYALWRFDRRRLFFAAWMAALGVGVAAVQLYPMARLIARSSRILPLDPPQNDISLGLERLWAIWLPWIDGAPAAVRRPDGVGDLTARYANPATFWDSVTYLGWTPWIGLVGLMVWCAVRKHSPGRVGWFLITLGVVPFLLSLSVAREVLPEAPFVVLRSPVRLMYLVGFAVAMGLGFAVDALVPIRRQSGGGGAARTFAGRYGMPAAIAVALAAHLWDLSRHARAYVHASAGYVPVSAEFEKRLVDTVGDGRVAIDQELNLQINRRLDDVGFFDSIMLAPTYQSLLAMNLYPPTLNVQELDGGRFRGRALAATGVRLILTEFDRPDTAPVAILGAVRMYELLNPARRVDFFPRGMDLFLNPTDLEAALRDPSRDIRRTLILPEAAMGHRPPAATQATAFPAPATIAYRRTSPDRFEIDVSSEVPGYVRVLESFDAGWRATVGDQPAPILPAGGMAMAVPTPAGTHRVVLSFQTPGKAAGRVIAGICGGLLIVSVISTCRRVRPATVKQSSAAT